MKILVTNDDGIHAEGIKVLAEVMKKFGEVVVIAPDVEKSAVGHGITTHQPLRIMENPNFMEGVKAYSISGTPSDCVKIGLEHILDEKPNILVSGINYGSNVGTDVLYSGTVSAAIEGAINEVGLSIAFSLTGRVMMNYSAARHYIPVIIDKLIEQDYADSLLNINIPSLDSEEIAGIKYTELGVQRYKNAFIKREDPHGRTYYWMSGVPEHIDNSEHSDIVAVNNNFISVTPLQYDLTNYRELRTLKDLNF